VEQVYENKVNIVNPKKEVRALITWLQNNLNKDKARPNMQHIYFDQDENWWAINPYAIIRGSMWDEVGKFVEPGIYHILVNTSKLIELGEVTELEAYSLKNIKEMWNTVLDLQKFTTPTINAKILIPIIKPFVDVSIHSSKINAAFHVSLRNSDTLPFGSYGALVMPIRITSDLHDFFKMSGFNVRYPMPKVFNYHHDAGHGWLEVDHESLCALGLIEEISEYSYMNGSKIYLEEDSDMNKFIEGVQKTYNFTPEFEHVTTEHSPIRNYADYQFKVDQVQSLDRKGE